MTEDVWTTKSGEKIPVKEMTDSHLLNTVNFLVRSVEQIREAAIAKWEQTAFGCGQLADFLQGEMAKDDAERNEEAAYEKTHELREMHDWLLLSEEVPQWDSLMSEAVSRWGNPKEGIFNEQT